MHGDAQPSLYNIDLQREAEEKARQLETKLGLYMFCESAHPYLTDTLCNRGCFAWMLSLQSKCHATNRRACKHAGRDESSVCDIGHCMERDNFAFLELLRHALLHVDTSQHPVPVLQEPFRNAREGRALHREHDVSGGVQEDDKVPCGHCAQSHDSANEIV
jgi:hypothetical protein